VIGIVNARRHDGHANPEVRARLNPTRPDDKRIGVTTREAIRVLAAVRTPDPSQVRFKRGEALT
jgi:hypothetical protein